jgi:cyclopropane fatty-acyl-phospholipid synthase-like methyltransferase
MSRALLRIPFVYRALCRCFNVEAAHRDLIARAGYKPGMRTLDIGCGPGDLANYVEPRDYVGIDVSEAYITHARRRFAADWHVLPAERVGELKDSFDLAVMFGVFHHLSDDQVRTTLAGLTRVLKPEGRFVLVEAVWPTHFWDLPGYVLRKLDRGNYVRSEAQWCRLLGECWRLAAPYVRRNFVIEYFGCELRPPVAGVLGTGNSMGTSRAA